MRADPVLVFAAIAFAVGVYMFARWRSPRPEFPPLQTNPDDPLLLKAMADAKASLPEFLSLARARPDTGLVKLYFVSSSNQVEYLWAEVLEVVNDDELKVRLVTPPVTHSGELDRLYICQFSEIEDWQVRDGDDKIHGGFTQRAMFAIARRDGVILPKKLRELEREYADG
jgi:uncharacterized protein YegJ (DUF2314 family)